MFVQTMHMLKHKLAIVIGAASLMACSTSFTPATPTQTDADRVAAKYPGSTLADLQEGKRLFEANCDNCHKLKNPAKHTETHWKKTVPRMAGKANKHGEAIDAKTQELITRYLVAMAKQ
jgi:cytochrome c5